MWDTGAAFPTASYAVEQYNVEENNPKVDANWEMLNAITGSVQTIKDMTEGRWEIVSNQMIFYRSDNVTEVARFDLLDSAGNPTTDAVFERVRV